MPEFFHKYNKVFIWIMIISFLGTLIPSVFLAMN